MVHGRPGTGAIATVAAGMLLAACACATAGDRLGWTGGVTEVEGAGGGGLVPWSLVAGLGTEDELGASAFVSGANTDRFSLQAAGVAIGVFDRLELSWARQWFDIGQVVPGTTLGQDVAGLKVRIAGDAVFDQDRWLPQLAAGALYKRTADFGGVPRALGAARGTGVDWYLAATKVFLGAAAGHDVLLDLTLRRSDANQYGLVGFGGGRGAVIRPEGSAALWLTDSVLAGAEYRAKRPGLASPAERDASDVFVAWEPTKHLAVVLAWLDLGPVAFQSTQRGAYLSVSAQY